MFITYRRTGGIFALLTLAAVAFAATVLTIAVAATLLIVALTAAATAPCACGAARVVAAPLCPTGDTWAP